MNLVPITLKIGKLRIQIFTAEVQAPLIVYHAVMNEGNALFEKTKVATTIPFHFAVINGIDWNRDMSPWAIPKISPKDTACSGGADEYLQGLLYDTLPTIEKNIPASINYKAIAGYSLAGLFAIYALYRTDSFSKAASCSGSLWYPNIKDYIYSHEFKRKPDCVYFSLGDKEQNTKNEFLKPVQVNTQEIFEFYRSNGVKTDFIMNAGNHYQNATERTAAGIKWILNN